MNKNIVLDLENVSKQYRLGEVGTGTLKHDLNRWWSSVTGGEDPYLKIGESNDRSKKGISNYIWALKDINFKIEKGQAVGIIGRNGAGKSTLFKLLSRITKPTTGSIKYKGRIASLLEVGTGFHPEMTGRENVFLNGAILGMTRKEISQKFDEIIDFAGVDRYIDTPVKRYSSGMYVRLAFAVAAHLESEILIVDEVLAVGDAEFQKKCIGKMDDVTKGQGRTILFVSHNIDSITKLCTSGIYMNNGMIKEVGDIKSVANSYSHDLLLKTNEISKNDGYIRFLKIEQIKNEIIIECKYKFLGFDAAPHLCYVISDISGNKLFGNNPKITGHHQKFKKNREGAIIATIKSPKLLDGDYLLSVRFGDGIEDYENLSDCAVFSVKNMVKFENPISGSNYGYVASEVDWEVL